MRIYQIRQNLCLSASKDIGTDINYMDIIIVSMWIILIIQISYSCICVRILNLILCQCSIEIKCETLVVNDK